MPTCPKISVMLLAFLALCGCAAKQQEVIDSPPSIGERCQYSEAQVAQVRQMALEFLVTEWPVLDAECEDIGNEIRIMPDGECGISGMPRFTDACPTPSHSGYTIVFDEATLEPLRIYWVAKGK